MQRAVGYRRVSHPATLVLYSSSLGKRVDFESRMLIPEVVHTQGLIEPNRVEVIVDKCCYVFVGEVFVN